MASIEKYKKPALGRLFLHNNRMPGDGIQHSNDGIDDSRTGFNYHLRDKHGNAEDVAKRLQQVFCLNKSDATVLCEVIVTLPKNVPSENVPSEDEEKFFNSVYDFYAEDFGEENIINAVVHKDEVTPHLHLDFVPVKKGDYTYKNSTHFSQRSLSEWKETHEGEMERLCAKDLLTRDYLDTMHARLSQYVEKDLGYEAEVLNGATENGNISVLKLKAATLKQQIEDMQEAYQYLGNEIAKLYTLAQAHGVKPEHISYLPLLEKIDSLSQRETVYRNIMKRNGYTYTKEDLDKLKALKSNPANSAVLNIMEGTYADSSREIESGVMYVLELDEKNELMDSPQKDFANNRDNADVRMMANRAVKEDKSTVIYKHVRRADYCFIRPYEEAQVSAVLKELEEKIKAYADEKRKRKNVPKSIWTDLPKTGTMQDR